MAAASKMYGNGNNPQFTVTTVVSRKVEIAETAALEMFVLLSSRGGADPRDGPCINVM